ncbi:phosphate transport system regulatory protein PhoU [Halalkalibacillus sediminis]|uniref:Phosphate-specific transport system accessory protein PhoU n=1 Tax=Halalkalibacillus sediminis TaxID=2018042 RepID=A0A2I0QSE4_9BACI|nr:phosphate signaling complex protein PhoU [Halalkalibacillus sediminis]PKR77253.1 phosphate transport system regulatory protein PhoU [Halalkalibacillus sediminis]
MVRENFEEKLNHLNEQVKKMSELSKDALNQSLKSLETQDVEKAQQIIENDPNINALEDEINDIAIWLIAKEQPVAKDLRRLVTTLKITNDIERIGDLAVNVSKSVIRIGDEQLDVEMQDILSMGSIVEKMIDDVIDAFVNEDVNKAFSIADVDDQVDQHYGKTVEKMLNHMAKHPEQIPSVTQLAFISRFLERAADHTTNISEGIIYLVKGKHFDLNA